MKMCSIRSPLMRLASLAFALFLAFSSSVVQSQSTAGKPPPPKFRHHTPPPPPSTKHHRHLSPPPPRPRNKTHNHRQPPPPPPPKKAVKSTMTRSQGLNKGKVVGLVFCGIVVILQIWVISYLTYLRNLPYRIPD